MRTLLLMRHAEAQASGASDVERALTGRGRLDARAVGHWLARQPYTPDRIVCSSALRAQETLGSLELPEGPRVVHDERLYLAPSGRLLEVIRECDADARSLLVIAHNPGIADLALELAASGPASTLENFALGFSAGTLAALEVRGAWSQVHQAIGIDLLRPADVREH